jgi:AcrR family transcriptional regulator
VAGCSRVSFYQYFSSKEDVFRHLAEQVARQLNASTDRLDPVTPDDEGWDAMRAWVDRYSDIYNRYEPVFHAFPAAAESDSSLADDSVRAAHRYVAGIRSRVSMATLAPRELETVLELLQECLTRTLDDVAMLGAAAPSSFPKHVILDAYTDVVHRSLFGLLPAANVHRHRVRRPPKLPFGAAMTMLADDHDPGDEAPRAGPARTALLEAARDVFVSRGYHGTRVDDIVEAAGVSHGAFYRYFKNKDELAYLLGVQAMQTVSTTLTAIPDVGNDGANDQALRRWLRSYSRAQAKETSMFRVLVDAALQDHSFAADSASALDWGRRRMVQFLRARDFGDAETDAVVLLSLVDSFGVRERSKREVDAAAHIVERGFLGGFPRRV